MATFVYIGGVQTSGDVQTMHDRDGKMHVLDDRQEEDMPASVEIFGHKWALNVPQQLDPKKFATRAAFDHAVFKLGQHKHFEECEEETPGPVFEEVKRPKRAARKAKAPVAE